MSKRPKRSPHLGHRAASKMWETTPIYSPDLAVHERHVGMSERSGIPPEDITRR